MDDLRVTLLWSQSVLMYLLYDLSASYFNGATALAPCGGMSQCSAALTDSA